MTSPLDPESQDFDVESSRLSEGLKCCRTVVSNYRALLAGDADESHAGFAESGDLESASSD